MKIKVIDGANVNLLGLREPDIYGRTPYLEIRDMVVAWAKEKGLELEVFQSNSEAEVVAAISACIEEEPAALVINPGDFLFSHPVKGALAAIKDRLPVIEVHPCSLHHAGGPGLSTPLARGVIAGFGGESYRLALEAALALARGREDA